MHYAQNILAVLYIIEELSKYYFFKFNTIDNTNPSVYLLFFLIPCY